MGSNWLYLAFKRLDWLCFFRHFTRIKSGDYRDFKLALFCEKSFSPQPRQPRRSAAKAGSPICADRRNLWTDFRAGQTSRAKSPAWPDCHSPFGFRHSPSSVMSKTIPLDLRRQTLAFSLRPPRPDPWPNRDPSMDSAIVTLAINEFGRLSFAINDIRHMAGPAAPVVRFSAP